MHILFMIFILLCGSLKAKVYNPKLGSDNYFMQKIYQKKDLERFAYDWAKHFKLDPSIVNSVIVQESSWNTKALSEVKAKGLMQLMTGTATDMGFHILESLYNPYTNVYYGCKYLRWLLDRYEGDYALALVGYYGGPKRADALRDGELREGSLKRDVLRYANEVLARSHKYTEVLIGQERKQAEVNSL